MFISIITAPSFKTIKNYQNDTEFEAVGNEIIKRCPHCHVSFVSDGGCPTMWCSRCQKKFCQRCLKPVTTLIPVQMHVAFGQCKGKEALKDQTLSMLLIIWTFFWLYTLTKASFGYILIISLMCYYFGVMFMDWIDSWSRTLGEALPQYISNLSRSISRGVRGIK